MKILQMLRLELLLALAIRRIVWKGLIQLAWIRSNLFLNMVKDDCKPMPQMQKELLAVVSKSIYH